MEATEPRYYPEYAPDYYATFFEDPDGVRLEVMNFREIRRKVMHGRPGPASEDARPNGVACYRSPDDHPSTLVHEGVAHFVPTFRTGK